MSDDDNASGVAQGASDPAEHSVCEVEMREAGHEGGREEPRTADHASYHGHRPKREPAAEGACQRT